MSFRTEEIKTYRSIVICDDCRKEKIIAETCTPLGFDSRMNGSLQNGYTFTQEGSVFKNYCYQCQSKRREGKS
ncbi:hypothetical protein NYE59_24045 [Paenibacillus sp. FSL L8-0323]|uniref:hypothetical protein n=1 Tax=Paenibacillus sp. FSL L8-0323 TaxID=2975330 RepID=UPI0030F6272E